MNVEELRTYCLSVKGAWEGFPFVKFARGAENILVFKVMGKMFAYIDLFPSDGVLRVWIKCDMEYARELQEKYEGVVPSMRNLDRYWSGVALESDVPDGLIRELIMGSVKAVIGKLSRQKQQEYREK